MMTKEEAAAILGVPTDAVPEAVEKRYEILVRRHRTVSVAERAPADSDKDMTRIVEAYHCLKAEGEPVSEDSGASGAGKRGSLLLRNLGIDEKKFRNIVYYYKWHAIIGVALLAVGISFVVGIVTRPEPEVSVAVIGAYPGYTVNQEVMEQELLGRMPLFRAIQLDSAIDFGGEGNSEYDIAVQAKRTVLITVADVDVFLCDRALFNTMAENGLFLEIRDTVEQSGDVVDITEERWVLYDGATLGVRLDEDSVFTELLGGTAEKIVCLSARTKNTEKAMILVQALLID